MKEEMKKETVGKIKNIKLSDSNELELTIQITDAKFKKKILRDLSLSGNLEFEGDQIIFIPTEESNAKL
jgi:hypothetical protein